jgi:nickel transport protein
MRRWIAPLTLAALAATYSSAFAHTAWLEPAGAPGQYLLRFGGHEGKLESYPPEKLKEVRALDAQGKALPLVRSAGDDGVRVRVQGTPALLALHFDNGIYSRAEGGKSVNLPMTENPGATQGTWAVKYGKTIAAWHERVTKPLGQPFEVVPLSAAAPRAGQPLRVRVLIDGKAAAGVQVAQGEEGKEPVVTDADGVASFVPRPSVNRLWAGRRTAVTGEPRYTQLSIEYVLLFEAR